jgi:hypothetical protein
VGSEEGLDIGTEVGVVPAEALEEGGILALGVEPLILVQKVLLLKVGVLTPVEGREQQGCGEQEGEHGGMGRWGWHI